MRRVIAERPTPRPEIPLGTGGILRDSSTLAGQYIDDTGAPLGPVTCLKCAEPECMKGAGNDAGDELLCPVNALQPPVADQPATITADCIGCGLCVIRCPIGAISLAEAGAIVVTSGSEVSTKVVSSSDHRRWIRREGVSLSGFSDKDVTRLAGMLTNRALTLKSTQFYPLVASLFRSMGIRAYAADLGVNNERIDVMLPDDLVPVPAEVKSATEVPTINAKSIQQALENKLTLARDMGADSMPKGSSLSIAFEEPPVRSGILETIQDIREAFGIDIGTVTTLFLYRLVLETARGAKVDRDLFANAKGPL